MLQQFGRRFRERGQEQRPLSAAGRGKGDLARQRGFTAAGWAKEADQRAPWQAASQHKIKPGHPRRLKRLWCWHGCQVSIRRWCTHLFLFSFGCYVLYDTSQSPPRGDDPKAKFRFITVAKCEAQQRLATAI